MSENKLLSDKLIKVFEKAFGDFSESIQDRARDCNNQDATTALYEVELAILSLDIPYLVREALDVPHPEHK